MGKTFDQYTELAYNLLQLPISVVYFTLTLLFEPKDFGINDLLEQITYGLLGFSFLSWLFLEAVPKFIVMAQDHSLSALQILWEIFTRLIEVSLGSGSSLLFLMYLQS